MELAGLVNLLRESRHAQWGRLLHRMDSSAGRSILLRKGAGQVKHLRIRELWSQQFVKQSGVQVEKVDRYFNSSDAFPGALSRSFVNTICIIFRNSCGSSTSIGSIMV